MMQRPLTGRVNLRELLKLFEKCRVALEVEGEVNEGIPSTITLRTVIDGQWRNHKLTVDSEFELLAPSMFRATIRKIDDSYETTVRLLELYPAAVNASHQSWRYYLEVRYGQSAYPTLLGETREPHHTDG